MIRLLSFLALALVTVTNTAHAVEVHVWEKEPIEITLEVGKQKIIEFDGHARFDFPSQRARKVNAELTNGSLYITALDVFDRTPARVTLIENNVQIRLVINAVSPTEQPVEHAKIELYRQDSTFAKPEVNTTQQQNLPSFMRKKPLSNVELMRFANQIYWLPERLRPDLPYGLTPLRTSSDLDLSGLMTHCSLGVFGFEVLDGFRTNDGRYLTTLKIENRTDQTRYINLTHWNTQALFVSARHLYVTAANTAGSYTTMTIITESRFENAINRNPTVFYEQGQNEGCL